MAVALRERDLGQPLNWAQFVVGNVREEISKDCIPYWTTTFAEIF